MKKILFVFAASVAMIVTGCQKDETATIEGSWEITDTDFESDNLILEGIVEAGDTKELSPFGEAKALTFTEKEVHAVHDNGYDERLGEYTLEGNRLTIKAEEEGETDFTCEVEYDQKSMTMTIDLTSAIEEATNGISLFSSSSKDKSHIEVTCRHTDKNPAKHDAEPAKKLVKTIITAYFKFILTILEAVFEYV